jgi:hypothetical protein
MTKSPNSKGQTTIKAQIQKKPKLNFTQSSYRIKSPTSKAQFKKPKIKMPNYNKKPTYRTSPN